MNEPRLVDESSVSEALHEAAVRADAGRVDLVLLAQRRRARRRARSLAMAGAAAAAAAVVAVLVGGVLAGSGDRQVRTVVPAASGGSEAAVSPAPALTLSAQRRDVARLCGAPPSRITSWDGQEVVTIDASADSLHQFDRAVSTSSTAPRPEYVVVYQDTLATDVVATADGRPVAVLGFEAATGGWRLSAITYC